MSSSSLYSYESNVVVSANNLTTLYNAQPGNVVVANVPDRNFTTLYTQQSDVKPTMPYGNSNVEAFLNVGSDLGGNTVQNINMSGTITVGGQSFLGNVGNVHIEGGNSGYVLTTNGAGELIWSEPSTGNTAPYIHFDVTSTGNNQSFTNTNLAIYELPENMTVFKNGVNIEPFYYSKPNSTTLRINILLNAGDTIDVAPSGGGGGSTLPGGVPNSVQYNNGYAFTGSATFTYIQTTDTLNVGNIVANGSGLSSLTGSNVTGYVANANHANIANIANTAYSVYVGNVVGIGTIATININGDGSTVLYGNGTWGNIPAISNVANANYANFANVANLAANANIANLANNATYANYANFAGTITIATQPNITSLGSLTSLSVVGTTTIQQAKEKFTPNNTGATGTVDFDVLTSAIILQTANASANFTLNIRGNATTTFDSIVSNNESVSITYINKNGATGYHANTIQIDGSNVTPVWVNGNSITAGTINGYDMYNFNILKTGTATYVVFAIAGSYL